jgi:hypothetical protein
MSRITLVALLFLIGFSNQSIASSSRRECLEFVFSKYRGEMTDDEAARLSFQACDIVSDMRVLEFLWSKHASKNSPAHAMDLSVEVPAGSINGKIDIVNHAYLVYSEAGLLNSAAATKAAFGASQISSYDCLVSRLSTFTRGQRTVKVIDGVFEACAAE